MITMTHVFYLDNPHDRHELDPQALDSGRYRYVASLAAGTDVFRAMNAVDGTELPCKLGIRSMSVGDVMIENGIANFCALVGWTEIKNAEFVAALMDDARLVNKVQA